MRDSKSRRTRDKHSRSIRIEDRQCAVTNESERTPFPCAEKLSVEKRDGRARRATGGAWMASEGMKHASRPWQTQRQPNGSARERPDGNAQPQQLVVQFTRLEATND